MSIRVIDSNGNLKMQVVSLTSTTIGNAINAVGAGTQTLTGGTLIFSNANGVTFGLNGSTLTASAAGGGGGAAVSFSAGTQSTTVGNLVFSNSNGVSFGLSNNTVTASVSHPAQSTQPVAISGSNGSFAFSTASFGNLNGLSFYTSNGSMVGSYTVPTVTNSSASISAGTQSTTLGNLVFSNSNGLAFGLSNNTITGSYTVPSTAGLLSAINLSAGTTSNNLSAFTLSNSNGLAFGLNGSVVTGSYTVPTQSNQNISLYGLGNTTQNSSTVLNASNLSFNAIGSLTVGYSNGSIQLSAPNALTSQTNQTANFYVSGNTTQLSSTAGIDLRSISFEGAGVASVGVSNGRVLISVPSGGAGGAAISAGANSQNTGTVNFSNANGITFGLSNNGTMTASHNGITSQSNQNISLFALGNTTQNSSTLLNASNLSFNAIGSLTVGYSNGSIQLSAPNALTSQSNQNVSLYALGNTTQNSSTVLNASNLSFNALGSLTVGYSNGSIQLSAPNALTSQSNQALSGSNGSFTFQTATFGSSNGMHFYTTNGSIVGSYTVPSQTTQPVAVSGSNGSFAFSTLTLGSSNGMHFYSTNGSIVGSYTVPTQSNQNISFFALGNTTQNSSTVLNANAVSFNGLGELSVGFSNGSINLSANVDAISAYAVGNSTQSSSGTLNVGSLSFNGAGNVSVGVSNGSIVISGGTAAASPVNFSAGTTSNNLGTVVFSNLNNVSFGLNGSTITGSVPATSSLSATGQVSISVNGSTISIGVPNPYISSYQNLPAIMASSALTWNAASISHAAAFNLPEQGSFSFIRIPGLMTTNSTTIATLASATASASGALYSTINAVIYSLGSGASSKSLQYVTSGAGNYTFSQQISVSNSTQGSYSLGLTAEIEGIATRTNLTTQYSISNTNYSFTTNQFTNYTSARFLDIPFAASLSAGPYWAIIGMSSSSASGGAAGLAALTNCNVRYSAHYGASQAVLSIAPMGASNKTIAYLGAGSFSTAGGGTTNSLNVTHLSSMASNAMMFFQLLRSA